MKKVALLFLFILAGMSIVFSEQVKANSQPDASEYEDDDDDDYGYTDEDKELLNLSPKELAELLCTEENEQLLMLYVLTLYKEGLNDDESIAPVTEERFKEILGEIENMEKEIKNKIKISGYVKEKGYSCLKAFGNTFLVTMQPETPYAYNKIHNPDPSNGIKDFISVYYTRPSKEGYLILAGCRVNLDSENRDELNVDAEDFASLYKECEKESQFTSSLKLDGKEYKVFFLNIEGALQ